MTQPVAQQQPTSKAATIPSILAYAEGLCRANQVRLTPIRRRVLEVLLRADRPLGAYDLAEMMAPQGRRMAPVTVYRALEFLIEQGLAHRLASLNAYVASSQAADGRSAAFLICESCGDVSEVASQELHEALSALHKSHAFSPRTRLIELSGRCAQC